MAPNTPGKQLFHQMVDVAELGPVTQERIFEHGLRERDWKLLAALARRGDTTAGIDDALSKVNSAIVARSWVARPGRTAAEVEALVDGEKRSGMLAAIAGVEGLATDTYVTLVLSGHANVAAALIMNRSVDEVISGRAAQIYGKNLRLKGYRAHSDLESMFIDRPELHEALASECNDAKILHLVAGSCLSPDTADRLAAVVSDHLTDGASKAYSHHQLLGAIAQFAANPALGEQGRRRLRSAVTSIADVSYGQSLQATVNGVIAALDRAATTPPDVEHIERCRAARAASDPAELAELARDANGRSDAGLAVAVARNRHSGPDLIGAVRSLLRVHVPSLLTSRADDAAAFGAIAALHPGTVTDAILRRCTAPADALAETLAAIENRGAVTVMSLASMSVLDVTRVPVRHLLAKDVPAAVSAAATAAITERCGDSDTRWATFASLADDHVGTLGDLLEVCETLELLGS